ncbi:hypothetical protein CAPTEDRAFT_224475 [Capitella teleta]|uniref:Uncharacterized protein n=1 Tax=Capitella teleta TaxID=283909 RepID=R7V3S8_CAPTE|nr:hypothetical protein CAPTEDRAFT_224475 [Capitella teleta]|eukprot:ELU11006.1 hypothetical protein CAPTEDRAFT_224475 [Capitella teleta]
MARAENDDNNAIDIFNNLQRRGWCARWGDYCVPDAKVKFADCCKGLRCVCGKFWTQAKCQCKRQSAFGTLCKYVVDMSYIEFICLPLCSYILPHWNGQHLEESEGHGSSAKNNNIINAPAPGNTYHLNTAAFPISPSSSNKH